MADFKKTFEDMQALAKSMQPGFAAVPVAGTQTTHFWQAQDSFLKEFEKFSAAWFKRRHEGTQAAMEASKQMSEHMLGNPTTAMTSFGEWQKHAMERMAQDAKDYMDMISRCTAVAIANEVEAVEETVETTKRATKPVKSDPV